MQSIFITTEDSRWQNILKNSLHEFYQRPKYLKLEASYNNAIPEAYFFEKDGHQILIPLLLFDLPFKNVEGFEYDAKSPYGYSGILFSENFPDTLIEIAFDHLRKTAKNRRILTIFIKLNTLLNTQLFTEIPHVEYTEIGEMVCLNLEKEISVLNKETSSRHTDNIKKLKKKGFTARFNDMNYLDDFVEAYWETMKLQKAQEYYFFSKEYFMQTFEVIGDDLLFCSIHDSEGNFACGGIFSERDFIGRALFTSTVEKYRKLGVSKYIYISTRDYLKEKGKKVLHLGGGLGVKIDSIFYFKAGFSSDTIPFKCLSVNIASQSYFDYIDYIQNLEDAKFENLEYFPAYRTKLIKNQLPT